MECIRCDYRWNTNTENKTFTICPKCRKQNPTRYEKIYRFTLMALVRWEIMKAPHGLKVKQIKYRLKKYYKINEKSAKITTLLRQYPDAEGVGSAKNLRWIIKNSGDLNT